MLSEYQSAGDRERIRAAITIWRVWKTSNAFSICGIPAQGTVWSAAGTIAQRERSGAQAPAARQFEQTSAPNVRNPGEGEAQGIRCNEL